MSVHLINPSHLSFGVGVITPRWLFVLAAATPTSYGRPLITDETLEPLVLETISPGDIVGIGIHTATVQRGERAGLLSFTRSLDAAELAQVGDAMEEVYALFVDRVASGRAMSAAEVDAVGRGRVWTGEQAVERGLVDRVGGLLEAID